MRAESAGVPPNPLRVVIVVSHPIQHFCPQYRSLAAHPGIDLTVIFASLKGSEGYFDGDFGEQISWGTDLLKGFEWIALDDSTSLSSAISAKAPDWLIVYGYGSPIARSGWRWALRH